MFTPSGRFNAIVKVRFSELNEDRIMIASTYPTKLVWGQSSMELKLVTQASPKPVLLPQPIPDRSK